jgi:Ca2+-binding EF-hand superfamily protein
VFLGDPSIVVLPGDDRATMISKIFKQTDKDRNGCINFDEFLELLKFMDIQLSYERALNLFASVDPDGSGSYVNIKFSLYV